MDSMRSDAGFALAHCAGDSMVFGDVVNAINKGKPYLFDATARPVNLQLVNFICIA